ncbi:DUF4401 domain-containing protein [Flammeovirga sp. SJP92]|uniref:DUF4401 domain-containing protein n=1 Tax=Flammeovirga sp. SJP92 TaxID=1775430 RepID=UPI000795131F|nr:DUF4401 domain-containing protein [Flammeovirga sp. SJP92]KXX70585.1 hypothetical protein AVL50_08255 [Flammeovirga sp. SJP92]
MNRSDRIRLFLSQYSEEENNALKIDKDGLEAELSKPNIPMGLLMKGLIYFGGFISSMFFILFIFLFGLGNHEWVLGGLGISFFILGILIQRHTTEIFFDSFSTFTFIIGQILLVTGLGLADISEHIIILLLIVINSIAILLLKRYMLLFLCALTVISTFNFWLHLLKVQLVHHLLIVTLGAFITFFFINEGKVYSMLKKRTEIINPILDAFIASFLIGLANFIYDEKGFIIPYEWITTVTISGLMLFFLIYSNKKLDLGYKPLTFFIFVILLAVPTLYAPYVMGCLFLLILGVINNYKTLKGLGAVTLVLSLANYYYDLELTLLEKSLEMMASGIVFLGLYWFFFHKKNSNEKV